VLPLPLARQILSGKRGIRTTLANQTVDVEEDASATFDDESSIDDFLSDDESAPTKRTRKTKASAMSFTHPDGTPVEVLEYDGKAFVRFADILPPCPPKGEFDVNKIRLSPYFFS
jgi:DNA-directed RNA polymerase